jgi:hypothetical protein
MYLFTANLLTTGHVLTTGGQRSLSCLATAELYQPVPVGTIKGMIELLLLQ